MIVIILEYIYIYINADVTGNVVSKKNIISFLLFALEDVIPTRIRLKRNVISVIVSIRNKQCYGFVRAFIII